MDPPAARTAASAAAAAAATQLLPFLDLLLLPLAALSLLLTLLLASLVADEALTPPLADSSAPGVVSLLPACGAEGVVLVLVLSCLLVLGGGGVAVMLTLPSRVILTWRRAMGPRNSRPAKWKNHQANSNVTK
jgi:hypothetical protein